MADPYRFDPLQFAVDQAEQNSRGVPPKPGGYGLGAVVDALWRSLPSNARSAYGSVPQALGELSPGAGVRDMVQSSGDLSRAAMAGDGWGMGGALAGVGLGAMGAFPGMRAPASAMKGMTAKAADAGVDRVAKALAFGAPTDVAPAATRHPGVDQWGYLAAPAIPQGVAHRMVADAGPSGSDALGVALANSVGPELAKIMGMAPQGGNKWSSYFNDRKTGANLRVSDHGAFNPGSMGTGVNAHGVTFNVGAGEMSLSSPAIKKATGHDTIQVTIPDEGWAGLSSPEGNQWIARILRGEF